MMFRILSALFTSVRERYTIWLLRSREKAKSIQVSNAIKSLGREAWKDWDIRVAAAQELGNLGDRRAVEPLIKALGDDSPGVVPAVVAALGQLGDPRAVEPLIEKLSKRDLTVSTAVAAALAQLADPRAVEPLISVLGDDLPTVRAAAATALGQLADPRAVEPLIKALWDADQVIRGAAAAALDRLGEPKWKSWIQGDEADFQRLGQSQDPRAVEVLIKALSDNDKARRGAMAVALEGLGEPKWRRWIRGDKADFQRLARSGELRAFELLVETLRCGRSSARDAAALALGQLGDRRAVEFLINALSDQNRDGAAEVATALGQLGDPRAVEPLIKTLGDRSPSVVAAAAEALGKLGDPQAVKALHHAFFSKDSSVVKAAALALAELRLAPQVALVIRDLMIRVLSLAGTQEWHRSAAAAALAKLGDPSVVEPLLTALSDPDSRVRGAVAIALGQTGDPRAVDPLIKALGDDSPAGGDAAVALGQLGDPRAVEPLIAALQRNSRWECQLAVAKSLGQLGDPRAVEPLIKVLADCLDSRIAAVLEVLGEPRWRDWIRGGEHGKDLERLVASGDPRAVEMVTTCLLRHRGVHTRRAAVEALGQHGGSRAVEPLIKALSDKDVDVRHLAAAGLGRLADSRAVEPLIRALGDSHSGVRWQAVSALERLGDQRAVMPLTRMLATAVHDVNLRRAVIGALTQLADPRAVGPLSETLGTGDAAGRGATAEALGRLGDKRAVAALVNRLGDSEGTVRKAVVEALNKLGEPKWQEWIKGDGGDLRRLGTSHDPQAVRPLIQCLVWQGKGTLPHRREAAAALSRLASSCSPDKLPDLTSIRTHLALRHQDSHDDDTPQRSNDCAFHTDRHADEGEAVPLSAVPAQGDF